MLVIKETKVTKCSDCPNFKCSMDGPFCLLLEEARGLYRGFVFPAGRHAIHPDCPLKEIIK